ncbi:MAG TPA: hypothetical protein P5570_02345 [Candidatus Paceibacterota bacterium]|nr:hypothetical protein [Candidatus Pacearchaeota archaeon]HPZ74987.1 hypothetical protein [Candidatus Pacearchaeota archaeon]HRR39574.1 hypothetical protein [Candidatus Paceibacterota bacterium]
MEKIIWEVEEMLKWASEEAPEEELIRKVVKIAREEDKGGLISRIYLKGKRIY